MRRPVAALVLAMLAALGAFAPAASAAAPAGAKVVIVVGATHGATAGYRADADRAYAEAIKYTSNVVKVYSPNATWAKVQAAAKGASILIYFGHGNGWPSPYTYDAKYATKDGFGLNATAGAGDYNNKYYGEPYVSTLALAPNAVIILGHLCYASGNSEPGNAAPSVTVARQRVDNYGAGFLKGNARAVIADGHGSPEPYIKALFTTHTTIEDVWRSAPNFNNHVKAFASTRTPGATAYTDTDSTTAGYYRSLVAKPGLTTDDVTGATSADTSVDPGKLVVPGNAAAGAAGAELFDELEPDPGRRGRRRRRSSRRARACGSSSSTATATVAGTAVHVQGLDDPSIDGWVVAGDLVPKDSAAPRVWGVVGGTARFSPNGDGVTDTATISGNLSEPAAWTATLKDADGGTIKTATGNGTTFSLTWGGNTGGTTAADGAYPVSVEAVDGWGNASSSGAGKLTVDTVAPDARHGDPGRRSRAVDQPQRDGQRETDRLHGDVPRGRVAHHARRRQRRRPRPQDGRPDRGGRDRHDLGRPRQRRACRAGRPVRGPDLADRRRREHRSGGHPPGPREHDPRVRDDVTAAVLPAGRRPVRRHDRAGLPAAPSRDRDLDDPERRGRDRRHAARRPASRSPAPSRAPTPP